MTEHIEVELPPDLDVVAIPDRPGQVGVSFHHGGRKYAIAMIADGVPEMTRHRAESTARAAWRTWMKLHGIEAERVDVRKSEAWTKDQAQRILDALEVI